MDEKTLIQSILNGNIQAFSEVVKRTEGLVGQIVFRLVDDPDERKDIAQDIYLKVYKSLSSFRFGAKMSTWVGQIAYNTCYAHLKRKKTFRVVSIQHADKPDQTLQHANGLNLLRDYEQEVEKILLKKELSGLIEKAVSSLPFVYKTLILLYYFEDLGIPEIAEITSLPTGTIKGYLFRARRDLKDILLKNYNREDI